MKRLLVWKIRRSYEISFSESPRELLSSDLRYPRPLWLLDVGVQAALQSDHLSQYLLAQTNNEKHVLYVRCHTCHTPPFLAPSNADRNRRHGRFLVKKRSSPPLPFHFLCPRKRPSSAVYQQKSRLRTSRLSLRYRLGVY